MPCAACRGKGELWVKAPVSWVHPHAEAPPPRRAPIQCLRCRGDGQDPRLESARLFNTTPEYAQRKASRITRRQNANRVLLGLLGNQGQDRSTHYLLEDLLPLMLDRAA
jgi:hypothetical protein